MWYHAEKSRRIVRVRPRFAVVCSSEPRVGNSITGLLNSTEKNWAITPSNVSGASRVAQRVCLHRLPRRDFGFFFLNLCPSLFRREVHISEFRLKLKEWCNRALESPPPPVCVYFIFEYWDVSRLQTRYKREKKGHFVWRTRCGKEKTCERGTARFNGKKTSHVNFVESVLEIFLSEICDGSFSGVILFISLFATHGSQQFTTAARRVLDDFFVLRLVPVFRPGKGEEQSYRRIPGPSLSRFVCRTALHLYYLEVTIAQEAGLKKSTKEFVPSPDRHNTVFC